MNSPILRTYQQRLALWIAQGFGSGRIKPAPGTWGTLFGALVYIGIQAIWPQSQMVWLCITLLSFIVGIPLCTSAGTQLGQPDHGSIVWDEIVAIWLVLIFTPALLAWQIGAITLFRLFDITKPPPIGWLDKRLKNGFGVMVDDVLAAIYTLLVIFIAQYYLH
jgi:phosphatidylglycerophosphatase A